MISLKMMSACMVALLSVSVCSANDGPSNVKVPDAAGQEMLIRNTIVAVNHGMITGNYTVLRDLSSTNFRRSNTAGSLANTFAGLKQQQLDLSPVLVTPVTLVQPAHLDRTGQQMKLVGFFATRPQAVVFSLAFRVVDGGWMIDEITISVRETETVLQAAARRRPQTNRPTSGTPAIPAAASRPAAPAARTVTRPEWFRP